MVFVLVFALVFVWYGIKFVQFGWNQTSELAELPMPFIFVAWPIDRLHLAAVRLRATERIARGRRRPPRRDAARTASARERANAARGAAVSLHRRRRPSRRPVAVRRVLHADGAARPDRVRAGTRLPAGSVHRAAALADGRCSITTFKAYNSFILLAVPFFLLTANLMNVGGITDRLVTLSRDHGRPLPRRARADQRAAVGVLRRDLRLVDGRRGEPGQDLHRGAGQGRLRPVVLDRDHARCRRCSR